uniref:Glutathione S-transferase n=1 Tax=Lotharella globosa TaxID=91324 RepID=A0A7S3Z0A6_9EUKA|mmetsp:Transcript_28831/g.56038  ORF Transcript_28831/g.56038 Transcript_28831/m.56038 type:complete len:214 (+) Transcript_28831:19-660(+)
MESKGELVYFDIPGRAEYIRLAGVIGNVPFKDTRLAREDFIKKKAAGDFPFSQVPVFLVGEHMIAQSTAILRMMGAWGGLYPKDPVEAAKVDAYLDLVEEAWSCCDNSVYATRFGLPDFPEKERLEIRKRLSDDIVPKKMGYLEPVLKESKSGYFGEKISIADIKLYCFAKKLAKGWKLDGMDTNLIKNKFPSIQKMVDQIDNLDTVKKYYKK